MAAKSTLEIVINGTTRNAEKAFSKVGKSVSALGKVAVGVGVAVGAAFVGIGVAAFKLAKDAAAVKGVRDAFHGLNQAAGDDMARALREGSHGMIGQMELMTSFNKAAQLVSVDFAKKLPDAMGYLSKVAAATGQDMGFMLDSLVTGVGRLSPMILDNLGIQVDLTAATEEYAKSIGKSADELSKSEQQTALMNQVMEKLAVNTEAMPEVVGSATQQWAHMTATFQDIKDEIGIHLLPMFQELLGWMNETLMPFFEQTLVPFIVDTLIPWLRDKLPKAIAILSGFWTDTLLPAIKIVWGWISGTLIPFFQNTVKPWLDDKLPKALATLSRFWEFTLKPAMTAVWEWMSGTLWPFLMNTVFPWLQVKIPAALATLSRFWEFTLKPAMMAVYNWMKDTLMPFFTDTVTPYLRDEMPENLETAGTAWSDFKGTLSDLNDWMTVTFIPLLWEIDEFLSKTLQITINNLTEAVSEGHVSAWTKLNDYFEEHIIPILWDINNFFRDKLGPTISKFITGVVDWLIKKLKVVNDLLDAILNKQDNVTTAGGGGTKSGRALGGPVMGGTPYAVGNELFVPNTSGYIVNNWNLTANYAHQSPNTLAQEIRLLEMLHT